MHYPYRISELDSIDAIVTFGDGDLDYILELEWYKGVMDIEFIAHGYDLHDTTNAHKQYRVLQTVEKATLEVITRLKVKRRINIHSISFRSSEYRGGKFSSRSAKIRTEFFLRYVRRNFPNSEVIKTYDEVLIKLNN